MQVDNLRAEVNQSAEVGQGLVGKDEHMDFNAAFELIADDGQSRSPMPLKTPKTAC
jgi:hypothetical protein